MCYSIEAELDSTNKQREHHQRDQFDSLKTRICQILLVLNEGKDFTRCSKKEYMQYCLETTLEFLLKQTDLISVFSEPKATSKTNVKAQQKALKGKKKKYDEN